MVDCPGGLFDPVSAEMATQSDTRGAVLDLAARVVETVTRAAG